MPAERDSETAKKAIISQENQRLRKGQHLKRFRDCVKASICLQKEIQRLRKGQHMPAERDSETA